MIRSVYLASPFFNKEQVAQLEIVEDMCATKEIVANSPRKFMVLPPRASLVDRQKVFDENVLCIHRSDIVLACIDWNDTGTIWEMGYAFAIKKPVVAYTFGQTKVNVMLACSTKGVLTTQKQIEKFLEGKQLQYAEVEATGKHWDFNWEVAKQWQKEIY